MWITMHNSAWQVLTILKYTSWGYWVSITKEIGMSNQMCVCVRKLHSYVDWYLFLFFAIVITLFCKNGHTLKTICLVLEDNILPTFCHLIFQLAYFCQGKAIILFFFIVICELHCLGMNGRCFLAFIVSLNFATNQLTCFAITGMKTGGWKFQNFGF